MRTYQDQELLTPWISGLPNGWKSPRIDDVCEVFFSNVDKHTVEGELPARLCNYVDVYKNEKITHTIDFMEASADAYELERFQIRKGDVLLTKDSEEPDDIAIASLVDEDLPGVICGYHLALIRAQSRSIKGRFLSWVHKSKPFRAQYEAKAVGITRFGLSQYAFRSARIPLPSAEEQDCISTYLDKQCSAIDKVLESKREQLTVLEELRKSIIHKAVTKGLDDSVEMKDSGIEWIGKISAKWKVARLKAYADINKQSLGEETEPDFSFYYIDIGNVDYEKGYEKKELIEFSSAPSRARRKVEQGDTIVSTVRTYLKAIAYVHEAGEDIVVSTGFAVVSPRRPLVMDKFLNHFLRSHFVIEKISSLSTGVGYPAIDSTRLSCIPIIIPSKEEQAAISEYLDAQCKRIMNLRDGITQQIEILEKYRQSLIHECVTGKRRITGNDLKELANV